MQNTKRERDEHVTEIINAFLDEHIYPQYVTEFQRHDDKETQVRGIDVTFTYHGRKFLCDEKAAARYIGKPLNSFILELQTTQRSGRRSDGWFLDADYDTDSYMFIWIDEADADYDSIESPSQIKKAEVVFVEYDTICDYIESLGWTDDALYDKIDRLEANPDTEPRYENGLKFSYNPGRWYEDPINLVISRNTWRELALLNVKYERPE